MKHTAVTLALLASAAWGQAQAQEVGQVISRTAIFQQITVPRQTCSQTPVAVPSNSSGGGALMGALAGGAMGNAIGDGSGRALATLIGIVGGAMVGDRIEGPGGTQLQNQTTCTTQNVYENRLVGYNVDYVYAGKQYSVQLPQDPGPTIQLQVTPLSASRAEVPSVAPWMVAPPNTTVYAQPSVVYVPAPIYLAYPPVFAPINLGWGRGGGYRHGHWR